MKTYIIKHHIGEDEPTETIVQLDTEILVNFALKKTDFLFGIVDGGEIYICKDSIYTITEIEPEVKGCY